MKCSVCGLESKGGPCPVCGFDQSLDWEHCPTLFPGRPELPVSQRRKRWLDTEKSALRCSGCGGIRFTVFPESGTLRCCDCGSRTTLALKKEEKAAPPPRLSYGGWNCSCGYHNSESARYCHNCSLPRPQQASGSAGGAGDGWTCICGQRNSPSSRFCVNCDMPRRGGVRPAGKNETWLCTCGQRNDASHRYCVSCDRPRR